MSRWFLVILFCALVVAEESWLDKVNKQMSRNEVMQLKKESKTIKERMQASLEQIVVELRSLNSNIARLGGSGHSGE